VNGLRCELNWDEVWCMFLVMVWMMLCWWVSSVMMWFVFVSLCVCSMMVLLLYRGMVVFFFV